MRRTQRSTVAAVTIAMAIAFPGIAVAITQNAQVGSMKSSDEARIVQQLSDVAKPAFGAARGGFVAITVPDLDASARWYVEKLGLKVVKNHAVRPDQKAAVTVLQGNGFAVELVWFAEAAPLAKVAPQVKGPNEIHGIFKSGIFVDDLDSSMKELKSRGVTFAFETFYDKSMDCRMFAIRDNNGNILQFFGK